MLSSLVPDRKFTDIPTVPSSAEGIISMLSCVPMAMDKTTISTVAMITRKRLFSSFLRTFL